MKKAWLMATTALMLMASGTWAAEEKATAATPPQSGMEHGGGHEGMGGKRHRMENMTLEEARARAHERAAKLDKMTHQEWEEKKKKRKERREKWKAMTPEQREKHKQEMREKRGQHMGGGTSGASDGGKSTAP